MEIKANETQNLIFENESDHRKHLKSISSDLAQMHFELSQIYDMELGFIIKPSYPLLVVSMLILFFTLNYFYSTAFALVVVFGYTLFRVIYTQKKIRARKVY